MNNEYHICAERRREIKLFFSSIYFILRVNWNMNFSFCAESQTKLKIDLKCEIFGHVQIQMIISLNGSFDIVC